MVDVREKVKGGIDSAADQAKCATDRTAGIAGQVKHKAEDAVDALGELATEAKDRVQHFAVDAKDKVQQLAEEAYDKAGDKLGTLSHDVTELVKKYPMQALLIGFGAGLLMGRVSRA